MSNSEFLSQKPENSEPLETESRQEFAPQTYNNNPEQNTNENVNNSQQMQQTTCSVDGHEVFQHPFTLIHISLCFVNYYRKLDKYLTHLNQLSPVLQQRIQSFQQQQQSQSQQSSTNQNGPKNVSKKDEEEIGALKDLIEEQKKNVKDMSKKILLKAIQGMCLAFLVSPINWAIYSPQKRKQISDACLFMINQCVSEFVTEPNLKTEEQEKHLMAFSTLISSKMSSRFINNQNNTQNQPNNDKKDETNETNDDNDDNNNTYIFLSSDSSTSATVSIPKVFSSKIKNCSNYEACLNRFSDENLFILTWVNILRAMRKRLSMIEKKLNGTSIFSAQNQQNLTQNTLNLQNQENIEEKRRKMEDNEEENFLKKRKKIESFSPSSENLENPPQDPSSNFSFNSNLNSNLNIFSNSLETLFFFKYCRECFVRSYSYFSVLIGRNPNLDGLPRIFDEEDVLDVLETLPAPCNAQKLLVFINKTKVFQYAKELRNQIQKYKFLLEEKQQNQQKNEDNKQNPVNPESSPQSMAQNPQNLQNQQQQQQQEKFEVWNDYLTPTQKLSRFLTLSATMHSEFSMELVQLFGDKISIAEEVKMIKTYRKELNLAIQLDHMNIPALLMRCYEYKQCGEYEKAFAICEHILSVISPNDFHLPLVYMNAANILLSYTKINYNIQSNNYLDSNFGENNFNNSPASSRNEEQNREDLRNCVNAINGYRDLAEKSFQVLCGRIPWLDASAKVLGVETVFSIIYGENFFSNNKNIQIS